MTRHDQLSKDLFAAFLGDLLHLVVPGLAGELVVEGFEPLPQEAFTDLPAGDRREMDLVGRVPLGGGEGRYALVNVEAEGQARARMPSRLRRYGMQLELRYDLPVVAIVVYRKGGPRGVTRQVCERRLAGEVLASFTYHAWGLSGSRADLYMDRPEPLAWALAALMRRGRWSRARHKFECLKRIAGAEVDEARRFLLVNWVESYIQLKGGEQQEYETLVAGKGGEDVAILEMTWADKLEAKGEAKGMRGLLLEQMEERFGPLPAAVRRHVEAVTSTDELRRLARKVLTAVSPDEMGLG